MCKNNIENKTNTNAEQNVKTEKFMSEEERKWNARYGILKQFQEISFQEAERLYGLSREEFSEMLERKRIREQKFKKYKSFFTDIIQHSTKPMPLTSNEMVGWRSARRECNLEFFGPLYRSRRFTIHPEGIEYDPPNHQKFIILG